MDTPKRHYRLSQQLAGKRILTSHIACPQWHTLGTHERELGLSAASLDCGFIRRLQSVRKQLCLEHVDANDHRLPTSVMLLFPGGFGDQSV